MPTQLKTLLAQRLYQAGSFTEDNLDQGEIYTFTPGNIRTNFCGGFCWRAPGSGTAVIEVWGAGGSSARMCCCGVGLPGNAGAYSKKCISVASGCYVTGTIGFACGDASTISFRGCSESTCICWFGNGTNGCICAQGGRGGCSLCSTGSSLYCCYIAAGYCGSNNGLSGSCGTICNKGTSQTFVASAVGGDVNVDGALSCATFYCVAGIATARCCTLMHIPGPGGVWSCVNPPMINHVFGDDSPNAPIPGQGLAGAQYGLGVNSQSGASGMANYCWTSNRPCGCYEATGCVSFMPYGWGAPGIGLCDGIRDNGYRGGMGAVRIRFIS